MFSGYNACQIDVTHKAITSIRVAVLRCDAIVVINTQFHGLVTAGDVHGDGCQYTMIKH